VKNRKVAYATEGRPCNIYMLSMDEFARMLSS